MGKRPLPPNPTPEQRVLYELDEIRNRGWYAFTAVDCPILREICSDRTTEGSPESAIRRTLLDLIDPPLVNELGREVRRPLNTRSRMDAGLMMRVIFGEADDLQFQSEGKRPAVAGDSRNLTASDRVGLAERIRDRGELNRQPVSGRISVDRKILTDVSARLVAEHPEPLTRVIGRIPTREPAGEAVQLAPRAVLENENDRRQFAKRHYPGRVPRKLALFGLAVLAIVVVVSITRGPGDAIPPATTAASPVNIEARTLTLFNESYGRKWGTDIRADPTDKLKVSLGLRNPSRHPSPKLYAWTETTGSDVFGGQKLRFDIATAEGQILSQSPWVNVVGWTNFFGRFDFAAAPLSPDAPNVYTDPAIAQTPASIDRPLNPDDTSGPVQLGSLPPRSDKTVDFNGSWQISKDMTMVTDDLEFDVNGSRKFSPLHAVRSGDHLEFSTLLSPQTAQILTDIKVRAIATPRSGGQYVTVGVKLINEGKTTSTSVATVNASDGQKISLKAVPGSTRLHAPYRNAKCHGGAKEQVLSDGITSGGTLIPRLMGFNPRSPCHGEEFYRFLDFDMMVTSH